MKVQLTDTELTKLSAVIGEMEESTSGEIRLMIVRRSSVIGHIPELLGLILLSITFVGVWFFRHDFVEHWWVWPAMFGVSMALSLVGARSQFIQRALSSSHDLEAQVWTRAEVEFGREIKGRTRSATGVLLFLSLMERRAVVLADQGIAGKLPPETWDQVVRVILSGPATGRWAEKLEEAIRLCGRLLAEHFPQEPGDTNELPNAVIIKD